MTQDRTFGSLISLSGSNMILKESKIHQIDSKANFTSNTKVKNTQSDEDYPREAESIMSILSILAKTNKFE